MALVLQMGNSIRDGAGFIAGRISWRWRWFYVLEFGKPNRDSAGFTLKSIKNDFGSAVHKIY